MLEKEKEISIVGGKNVSLIGFNNFDKSEHEIVRQIMNNYLKKIEERTDYDELKIRLKSHKKNKMFIHEINAELFINPGTVLSAEFAHKNPYKALTQVMIKIINEIKHQKKKSIREKPIKKLNKKI